MFLRYLGKLSQFLSTHFGAGRVSRIAKEDYLSPGGDSGFNLGCFQLEFVIRPRRYWNRDTVGQTNAGRIANIVRVRHDDFIAGVQDRSEGQVHRLA